ncbi:delta-60 repeat domain-containing protein/Por secretion system C-terminal sorting domain-containing protein [Chryseolinea serpens]|uniref:Delta-60 repeat domain-containing protein/Por secretion system C-terminal sorting domain-containing protein n=1 Tax=Chryseolinea serpens TaxID=947013 RepID=A0A1M5M8B7_9BACT|nr:T9SS type A sorting domain-containing protein [Chryseolinea serpens]SHG73468.1 delta-60 repeat domain-containing protein/Por secretion system C-terminal sorting domain-containing protein [Chryseolinea serpens]
MKFITCCLLCLAVITCKAQLLTDFDVPFGEPPTYTQVCESVDGKYFVYGDIDKYGDESVGSLLKVDATGTRVPGFKTVQTDDRISQVIPLASGKILVHGYFRYINGVRCNYLARLNADGSVDESFVLQNNPSVGRLLLQSDGKMVTAIDDSDETRLVRYNADGSIDPSFAFSVPEPTWVDRIYLDRDDHVFVSTGSWIAPSALIKLKANGDVDDSFHYTYNFYGLPIGTIIFQDDGRLVFSATHVELGASTYHLMRLNPDGSKDNTFYTALANGIVLEVFGRQNGNIIFSTGYYLIDDQLAGIAELDKDGHFVRPVASSTLRDVRTINEDSGGNLLLTGRFEKIDGTDISHTAKIKPDNTVDLSFKVPIANINGVPTGNKQMAVQSTGKVLLTANTALLRLHPDGTIDNTFAPALPVSDQYYVGPVAVQDDDKIIVGGSSKLSEPTFVGRLNADGSLDATFQTGTGPQSDGYPGSVTRVIVKSGKIYVAGYFNSFNDNPSPGFAILDMNGKWIGPEKNGLGDSRQVNDMDVQSDGKIILITLAKDAVRLNADGSKDDSFTPAATGFGFRVDAQDRIYMRGWFYSDQGRTALVRLDKNGAVDNSFKTTLVDMSFGQFYFVQPLYDNMIAVGGGFSGFSDTSSPAVMILDDEGSPVAMNNPLDSMLSNTFVATYRDKTLYMFGRFSREHGMKVAAGAKIVFSDTTLGRFVVKAQKDEAAKLTWRNNVKDATGIRIERSTPDDAHFEVIDELAPNVTSYIAKDLQELTPYYFRITGYNDSYSSSFVGHDSTLIAPQPALPATKVTDDSFTANWKAIPLTDSVMLQVSSDNFVTFLPGYEKLILKGTNSATLTGLEVGQQIGYRVKRFRNGKSSDFSEVVTTSIVLAAEENVLSHLQVYPNPTRTQLTVTLPENTRQASASVHSLQGTRMASYALNSGTSQLDVQTLPAGVYILGIAVDGVSKNVKFVKLQ